MTVLKSYDLNGQKLSFANWISNLSPQETPFTSMTGKESITNILFQWQTDTLAPAGKNAQKEGGKAAEGRMRTTEVKKNITQILRKVVKVSDTANSTANYGRGTEIQYQMEKAGQEIKRDLELALLNNINSVDESADHPRRTAGFEGLVAGEGLRDPDTGAVVNRKTAVDKKLTEVDIFSLTYNLYLSGSDADVIMYHPKWASVFAALQEKAVGGRERIFENTPKFSVYVSTIVDPLGQEFKLIPNRWMPEGKVFFFNSSDWTQMVLRAPQRTKLAKSGSYEKWMVEMEVGLRHRHPFASGILNVDDSAGPATSGAWSTAKVSTVTSAAGAVEVDISSTSANVGALKSTAIKFLARLKFKAATSAETTGLIELPGDGGETYKVVAGKDRFALIHNGKEEGHWTVSASDLNTWTAAPGPSPDSRADTQPAKDHELFLTSSAASKHNGEYRVELQSQAQGYKAVAHTASVGITVA